MNTIDFCQQLLNHLTSCIKLPENFMDHDEDEAYWYDDDEEDPRDAYQRSIALVNPTSGQYS